MGAHRPQDARSIAALLPGGTPVYVNHLPRHRLLDTVPTLIAVREAGLEPVPHIAARRVADRAELKIFLERAVAEAGVRKALIIGGDQPTPAGPYADGAALIRDGLPAAAGLREIGLPGYPEGHPRIPRPILERALAEKRALLAAQGLGVYVVTQFSFAPARVIEYCSALARSAPSMPVYVGLAGPTNPVQLLRFAQRCGVSASLRALRAEGLNAVRLVTHTDPADQLSALARYCAAHADCNVVGVHLFTFGGVEAAARWMNGKLSRI
jgi:methylenetetrahydrofolate reductase (NADPH)